MSDRNGGTIVASGTVPGTGRRLVSLLESGHLLADRGAGAACGYPASLVRCEHVGREPVGLPQAQDGNSYFYSTYYGSYFQAATSLIDPELQDGGNVDSSEGVVGVNVPEPATGILAGGLLMLAWAFRRRLTGPVPR